MLVHLQPSHIIKLCLSLGSGGRVSFDVGVVEVLSGELSQVLIVEQLF
jgi:hypothetical protein